MVKRGNFSFQTNERWSRLKKLLITNTDVVNDTTLCKTLTHLIHKPTQNKKNDEYVDPIEKKYSYQIYYKKGSVKP